MRFGELHRAHPLAADELAEILLFKRFAAVSVECVDRRHCQHGPDAESHRGRIPHLDACSIHGVWEALSAPIGRRGKPVPPGAGPGGVSLFPAGRRGDAAVLERCAEIVTDLIEWRDDVARVSAGFGDHGVDRLLVEVAIKAFGQGIFKARCVFERDGDVGYRGTIGHRCNLALAATRSTHAYVYILRMDVDWSGPRRYGPAAASEIASLRLSGSSWGVAKW